MGREALRLSVSQGGTPVLGLLLVRGWGLHRALGTQAGLENCCDPISSKGELHSEGCGEDGVLLKSHVLLNGCKTKVWLLAGHPGSIRHIKELRQMWPRCNFAVC